MKWYIIVDCHLSVLRSTQSYFIREDGSECLCYTEDGESEWVENNDWREYFKGWTIMPNYSDLPTSVCAECNEIMPRYNDYLCQECRG